MMMMMMIIMMVRMFPTMNKISIDISFRIGCWFQKSLFLNEVFDEASVALSDRVQQPFAFVVLFAVMPFVAALVVAVELSSVVVNRDVFLVIVEIDFVVVGWVGGDGELIVGITSRNLLVFGVGHVFSCFC